MASAKNDAGRLPVVGLAILFDLIESLFPIQHGHDDIQHNDKGMMGREQGDGLCSIRCLFASDRGEGGTDDGLVKFSVLFLVVDNQNKPGIAGHGTTAFRGDGSFAFCHFPGPQKGIFDYLHQPVSIIESQEAAKLTQ